VIAQAPSALPQSIPQLALELEAHILDNVQPFDGVASSKCWRLATLRHATHDTVMMTAIQRSAGQPNATITMQCILLGLDQLALQCNSKHNLAEASRVLTIIFVVSSACAHRCQCNRLWSVPWSFALS
jgi:hypothetical protein